jgi:hypothetical protein
MGSKARLLMRIWATIAFSFGAAVVAPARTIYVDANGTGDYPTIQAAIDAATDGDTIILEPGTYTGDGNRDIDFKGKAITIQSTDPRNPNVVASTVIDCQATQEDAHRGFYFHNHETTSSVLSGITIANGYSGIGGGVYCDHSSPMISHCMVTGNSAGGYGGGFYCTYSNLKISHCTISGNIADQYDGGGICCYWSSLTINNSIISGNSATDDCGGGIFNKRYSDLHIKNCMITGNVARFGGGIYLEEHSEPYICNSTFASNSASSDGGAIYSRWSCHPRLTNCILWNNSAPRGPEIALTTHPYSPQSEFTIGHSDVRSAEAGVYVESGCILHWGIGNINADPFFINPEDGDYHLSTKSLCINAGDPSYTSDPGETDIDGDRRVLNGRIDIGADELKCVLPVLGIPVTTFNFSALEARSNPEPQVFKIQSLGPDSIKWEVTEDCPWLQVMPTVGESSGEVDEVTLDVDITGLVWGNYYADLTISDPEAVNSPQTVKVNLAIHGPKIELSATHFEFEANQNGPNPPEQILRVRNGSGGRLMWQIAENCDWLRVNPTAGESVSESHEVAVGVDIIGLAWGVYNCKLTISDTNAINSPQTASIDLSISHNAVLHVPSEYLTIQAAIDAAVYGDTVVVADGIYTGNGNRDIDFLGKAITVRGENGAANCIIDCQGNETEHHRGFIFQNDEGPNSIISGVTIINGFAESGGAIYCTGRSSPTIRCCLIMRNRAYRGGGICTEEGGRCSPLIIGCVVVDNTAVEDEEHSWLPGGCGGGVFFSGYGGGPWGSGCYPPTCYPHIRSCTVANNVAEKTGGGIWSMFSCDVAIENSIAWGNIAAKDTKNNDIGIGLVYDACNPKCKVSYSNVKDGLDGIEIYYYVDWGPGNIDTDPCFADPNSGDYHLKSQSRRWEPASQTWVKDDVTSPCIDAGDPMSPIGHEPFPNGGRINMGAYGGTGDASKSYFGKQVCETIVAGDINGDCKVDFADFAILALHWLEDHKP